MKKGTKILALTLLALVFTSILISVISAQNMGVQMSNILDEVTNAIKPISEKLLGTTTSGEWLFAKVLFLIMILGIVFTALSNVDFFSDKAWVLWIVSIGVSILSVRWLSEGIVQTILLPYTALGIAVTALIPFVVYFILIYFGFRRAPQIVRRIAWLFFAVIFIGLWLTRGTEISGSSEWIYPITALAAIIMMALDGTFKRLFEKIKAEKQMSAANYIKYSALLSERDKTQDALTTAIRSGDTGRQGQMETELGRIDHALARLLE